MTYACPVCGSKHSEELYRQHGIPIHSVQLAETAELALAIPTGDLHLQYCSKCGFAWNCTFDPALMSYDQRYEETQGYSQTFLDFQRGMASDLIDRFGWQDKSALEIGCGKGEFLNELVDLGLASAIGFDPSYQADRLAMRDGARAVAEHFPPSVSPVISPVDVVWCKMTLEHIHDPLTFVQQIHRFMQEHAAEQAKLVIMVPALERILSEQAYWDIYYEHCNYFSQVSLASLLERSGFYVNEITPLFDAQYINVVASLQASKASRVDADPVNRLAEAFKNGITGKLEALKAMLQPASDNQGLLIWGAASKAVSLLQALPELQAGVTLVDINPHKHDTFLPATELMIHAPQALTGVKFEQILIANPVYEAEIRAQLQSLQIDGPVTCLA